MLKKKHSDAFEEKVVKTGNALKWAIGILIAVALVSTTVAATVTAPKLYAIEHEQSLCKTVMNNHIVDEVKHTNSALLNEQIWQLKESVDGLKTSVDNLNVRLEKHMDKDKK